MPDTELTTGAFTGANLWDPDRSYELIAESLDSDPLLAAMTTIRTARGSIAFPHAEVDGASWVAELGTIPDLTLDDSTPVVVPAKLAGKFLLSAESLSDTDWPIASFIRDAINTSVVRKAAVDVLYGDLGDPDAPTGVFDSLSVVTESTLRAGVVKAVAQMARAHGRATTVVVSPELWAAEVNRREALSVPSASADGLFADLGVTTRISPSLEATDALVLDSARCYKVLRRDVRIESSDLTADAWNRDGTSVRVIARLAAAIPRPTEAARAVTVTGFTGS